MKLIPMTDFVLEQSAKINDPEILSRTLVKRAKFLKQILNIGMFVPCDEDGNPIEEYDWVSPDGVKWEDYEKQLTEAKKRVLFEGFSLAMKDNDFIHLDFQAHSDNNLLNQDNQLIYDIENNIFCFDSDYACDQCSIIEELILLGLILTESGKQQSGL